MSRRFYQSIVTGCRHYHVRAFGLVLGFFFAMFAVSFGLLDYGQRRAVAAIKKLESSYGMTMRIRTRRLSLGQLQLEDVSAGTHTKIGTFTVDFNWLPFHGAIGDIERVRLSNLHTTLSMTELKALLSFLAKPHHDSTMSAPARLAQLLRADFQLDQGSVTLTNAAHEPLLGLTGIHFNLNGTSLS